MQNLWMEIQQKWPEYLWTALGLVLIYIVAHIGVRISAKVIKNAYERRTKKSQPAAQRRLETASTVLQSVVRYSIWFVAIIAMVGQLGMTSAMSSMLTAAGIGGIALGIGAQSFVKDVVAGLFFVLEDRMSVGDYVELAGVMGTVEEITLRTTVIKSFRGELHTVPNGTIGVITNFSRADYLAVIDMEISYEADIERAMACMREEGNAYAAQNENVVQKPEVLGITMLGGSGLTLRMVMRVRPMTQFAIERDLRLHIRRRFSREGIPVPYQKVALVGADT